MEGLKVELDTFIHLDDESSTEYQKCLLEDLEDELTLAIEEEKDSGESQIEEHESEVDITENQEIFLETEKIAAILADIVNVDLQIQILQICSGIDKEKLDMCICALDSVRRFVQEINSDTQRRKIKNSRQMSLHDFFQG